MSRQPFAIALVLGASAFSGGCVTAAVGAVAGVGALAAQERTFGQGLDDSAASLELRTKLSRSDLRGYSDVDVKVVEGRVLLAGSVPSQEHRVTAERIAWSSRGVAKVENLLEVGAKAGIWRSVKDEAITGQIRSQLMADAQVRGIDFGVETHKGVVYLMGVARHEQEVKRAAEIASFVKGVERVISYVEVRRPGVSMPPAPSAAPIEERLVTAAVEGPAAPPEEPAAPAIGAPLGQPR